MLQQADESSLSVNESWLETENTNMKMNDPFVWLHVVSLHIIFSDHDVFAAPFFSSLGHKLGFLESYE